MPFYNGALGEKITHEGNMPFKQKPMVWYE